jgi:hypothetical protein
MIVSDWGQDGVDTDVPNIARIYDYYLGGLRNVGTSSATPA